MLYTLLNGLQMNSIKITTHNDFKHAEYPTTIRSYGTFASFIKLLNNLERYCNKVQSDITIEYGNTSLISYDASSFNPWRNNDLEVRVFN